MDGDFREGCFDLRAPILGFGSLSLDGGLTSSSWSSDAVAVAVDVEASEPRRWGEDTFDASGEGDLLFESARPYDFVALRRPSLPFLVRLARLFVRSSSFSSASGAVEVAAVLLVPRPLDLRAGGVDCL